MDAETRFGGGDGKARAEAFQNDLLSRIGIGTWPADIWPALTGYLSRVESVKTIYAEIFNVQEEVGLGISDMPTLSFQVEEPDGKRDGAAELQQTGLKSILKNSSSSMSGQSFSTYASSYSSASELMLHQPARGIAELDDPELHQMDLMLHSSSHRGNQASFDSSKSSPPELGSTSDNSNLSYELQPAKTNPQPLVELPSIDPGVPSQARPIAMDDKDDVFIASVEKPTMDKGKAMDLNIHSQELANSNQHSDSPEDMPALVPFPALRSTSSAMTLKEQLLHPPATTPSERTLKLIKSSWKSTENLFAKLRAHEQQPGETPVIPNLPTDGPCHYSQRRPSKSVRFSDEDARAEMNTETSDSSQEYATGIGLHDASFVTDTNDQQQTSCLSRPVDPWQYARDYLLEKIKAEQEGRQCTVMAPSPEWFSEMDCAPSRQSMFSSKFGRNTITKLVSNVSGSSSAKAPSLLRNVSGDSNASMRTRTFSSASSFTEGSEKSILQDMAVSPQQVDVGA